MESKIIPIQGKEADMATFFQGFLSTLQPEEEKEKKPKASTELRKKALALGVEAFQDLDCGDLVVRFPRGGVREARSLEGKHFKAWLTGLYANGEIAPAKTAVDEVVRLFEADAHGRPPVKTYVRIAHVRDKTYFDLGDSTWRVVEIDGQGWRIVDPPDDVVFRRGGSLSPLPVPEMGGSLLELRRFLNVSDSDFVLVLGWLLGCFCGGPYPMLALKAEQGSGKSTATQMLKDLIDPEPGARREPPKDGGALTAAASAHHVVSYDNLSYIDADLSDRFCRLMTGAGISNRELYTNNDEFTVSLRRPLIINGIGLRIERGDLLSRTYSVRLAPIPHERRLPEQEIQKDFDMARPQIIGAILTAVSAALRSKERFSPVSRMADAELFVRRAEAEGAFPWTQGTFAYVLESADKAAIDEAMDGDVIAQKIIEMVDTSSWQGTVGELFKEITGPLDLADRKHLPSSPRALRSALDRLAPLLREHGIEIATGMKTNKGRLVHLKKVTVGPRQSQTVTDSHSLNPCNDWESDGRDGRDGLSSFRVPEKKEGIEREGEEEKKKRSERQSRQSQTVTNPVIPRAPEVTVSVTVDPTDRGPSPKLSPGDSPVEADGPPDDPEYLDSLMALEPTCECESGGGGLW